MNKQTGYDIIYIRYKIDLIYFILVISILICVLKIIYNCKIFFRNITQQYKGNLGINRLNFYIQIFSF